MYSSKVNIAMYSSNVNIVEYSIYSIILIVTQYFVSFSEC